MRKPRSLSLSSRPITPRNNSRKPKTRRPIRRPSDEKLTAKDVFEDDDEYVTEEDDVMQATAPDLDDVDEESEEEETKE